MVKPGPDFRSGEGERAGRMTRVMALRFVVLVVVLAVVSAGGCAAASRGPSSSGAFHNGFVELRYPSAWRAVEPAVSPELHVRPLLYLSVQPTRNPCRTSGTVTSCGWPVRRLRRGGLLIVWENRGYPGWSLASAPGRRLRVGGREARLLVSHRGVCSAIGADETIAVAIARPLAGNWTAFTACLRGPGLPKLERDVERVLASTRFVSP
jgi:hypothetical protein